MRIRDNFSTSKLSALLDLVSSPIANTSGTVPYNVIFGNPCIENAKDGYMKFSSPSNEWARRMHVNSTWKIIKNHKFQDLEPLEVEWKVQSERKLKGITWTNLKLTTSSIDKKEVLIEESRTLAYLPFPYEGRLNSKLDGGEIPGPFDFKQSWSVSDETLRNYASLIKSNHKIHLDRGYCSNVEGYPDLVVQGTLIATAMMNSFERNIGNVAHISGFSFKAVSPAFVNENITLSGTAAGQVWAFRTDPTFQILAKGQITFAQ